MRKKARERYRIAQWPQDHKVLLAIRHRVFVLEQGVPTELEYDALDPLSSHFIATADEQPVATARLTPQGQIGRMAVLAPYRQRGIGSGLLREVMDYAHSQAMPDLFLHAQRQAIGFYKRFGFATSGDTFSDAGIEHQCMIYSRPD